MFDTKDHTCLHFILQKMVGFGIFKKDNILCYGPFDLLSAVENPDYRHGGEIHLQVSLGSGSINGSLLVNGRFETPVAGNAVLQLKRGAYETVVIPENIQTLWGPIALERLPRGKDNTCKVASHR